VKVRRLTWRAYRIPFRRPFVTSRGVEAVREGFIVRLDGESGLYGLGEIAPLRYFAADDLTPLLGSIHRRIAGVEIQEIPHTVQHLDARAEIAAAIRCGLDFAACDLLARYAGVPLAEALGNWLRGTGVQPVISGCARPIVQVNATIADGTPETAVQSARHAIERGFRCFKLKVGMRGNLSAECALVGAVRDAIGTATLLRLDANQAWDVGTAIDYIHELGRFNVEFIEQPVAAGNIEGLAKVRGMVDVPIAADEAVGSLDSAKAIIETGAADVLVLKPMMIGGLRPALEIAHTAAAMGIESVVTTTIDSGVGVAAALHLAASFEGKRACGLATADLLESDLTSSTPQPRDGQILCPDTPGLGVEIDEVKAAPYLERA